MNRFVIALILVFALASHAYGMGWRPECTIFGRSCDNGGSTVSPAGNTNGGTTGTTGNNPGGNTTGNTGGNTGGKNAGDSGTNNGPNNGGVIVTTSTSGGSQDPNGGGTQAVPEPLTLLLLGSGLMGIVALRKKFKK